MRPAQGDRALVYGPGGDSGRVSTTMSMVLDNRAASSLSTPSSVVLILLSPSPPSSYFQIRTHLSSIELLTCASSRCVLPESFAVIYAPKPEQR